MITKTEVLKAIADIESAAPGLYPLDNLTVRVPRGALSVVMEAAKTAQYKNIGRAYSHAEWVLKESE